MENIEKYKINFIKRNCNEFDDDYIKRIVQQKYNQILVFLISGNTDSYSRGDEIGFVIIRKIYNSNNKVKYAIPLLGIHFKMRKFGYGFLLLKSLERYIKKQNKNYSLVLHSLKLSVRFYENYGFKKINKNRYLENVEEIKQDDVLMEFNF